MRTLSASAGGLIIGLTRGIGTVPDPILIMAKKGLQ
jgi:hypothetical protein